MFAVANIKRFSLDSTSKQEVKQKQQNVTGRHYKKHGSVLLKGSKW